MNHHQLKPAMFWDQSEGLGMTLYHNHSVPWSEPSVSFGWILDDVVDVAPLIVTFGEGETQAALF